MNDILKIFIIPLIFLHINTYKHNQLYDAVIKNNIYINYKHMYMKKVLV